MRNPTFADKDYSLWIMLNYVRDIMLKLMEKELEKQDISYATAAALLVIHMIGNQSTPTEIARRLFRGVNSVSGLLARMEKKGLVNRVNSLERKNMVRVALTKKGERAYQQSAKMEPIHRIMTCLSEKERRQLRTCLRKLWDEANKQLGQLQATPLSAKDMPIVELDSARTNSRRNRTKAKISHFPVEHIST